MQFFPQPSDTPIHTLHHPSFGTRTSRNPEIKHVCNYLQHVRQDYTKRIFPLVRFHVTVGRFVRRLTECSQEWLLETIRAGIEEMTNVRSSLRSLNRKNTLLLSGCVVHYRNVSRLTSPSDISRHPWTEVFCHCDLSTPPRLTAPRLSYYPLVHTIQSNQNFKTHL